MDGWMAWRALFCGHNNRWRRVVNEKSKLYCLFAGWLVSRLTGQLLSRIIFRVLRNIGMLMLHMTQIWRSMIAKAHAPLPTNYCSAICSLLSPVQLVMSLRKIQPIYLFLDVWVCEVFKYDKRITNNLFVNEKYSVESVFDEWNNNDKYLWL